jgi:hypothetical protein
MSTAVKPDLWDLWERTQTAVAYAPEPEKPSVQETTPEPARFAPEATQSQNELRHSRRRQIHSNAEVVDWHCVQVKPDVAPVADASPDGILFQSDREYRVGMELLVRFPFPCASSPKQRGTVVRVVEQPDGHRSVAVRFG